MMSTRANGVEAATYLWYKGVCDDFAREKAFLVDHDAPPLIEDGDGEDDLLRLAGIVSPDPTRVNGADCQDNTGGHGLHSVGWRDKALDDETNMPKMQTWGSFLPSK